ncbi:MAG: hypothetical protein K2K15_03545 [Anaeroplasmataceae bacterium]|nr:hypothetical protein [Anaeroplasmataceae bacterium]
MRKIIRIFIPSLLLAYLCLLITSCGKDKIEELISLDDPTGIKYDVETSKVSWDFVTNADYYLVSFDDGAESKVYTNNVTYSSDKDEFEFHITAKSDGLFIDSNLVTMTFAKLPSDITLSVTDDGKVTWNEVNGATGYEVMVDGVSVGTVPTPIYEDVIPGKVHSIKVKPIKSNTENVYYYSSWSEAVSINKLGSTSIDTITYNDGVIKWNSIASAIKYKVTINGKSYETETNEYTYDANKEGFNVSVQAIGNHTSTFDGTESAQKSFVYLRMVDGITVENGALVWKSVENATSYQIKLLSSSSTPVAVQGTTYDKLASDTQYNISILPVGNSKDTSYFADWSTPVPVYILPAPQITWTASVDVNGKDAINAIQWQTIDQAAGYAYNVTLPNGQVDEGTLGNTNNFYSSAFATTGTYVVKVKATSDGSAGVYDSAYSTPITVKRLEAPTISNNKIISNPNNLANGFTVSFDKVTGATSYRLYQNETMVQNSSETQFRVTDIVENGNTREVSLAYHVQSMGSISSDGKTVTLNSIMGETSTSSGFNITVLATPLNPTITGTDNYSAIYSFIGTNHDYGYNVNIGGSDYTSASTEYALDAIREGSYEVKVCSSGNGHEVLASTYSTSIQVIRLNSPYNLEITTDESDGVLKFVGDNHAQSYKAIITGHSEALTVDNTTNIKEYITTQATIVYMHSIGNYFADAQETIYYMTSRASANYTFIKLEAPTNITFTNENMSWNRPSNLHASATFTPTYKIANGATGAIYNGEFAGLSYPLSNLEAGVYSFNITAIGDGIRYINSESMPSKEIRKLTTPNFTVNTSENKYEWNSVASASGYVLSIDGQIVSTDIHEYGSIYYYAPHYDVLGTHDVKLYAQGDDGNTTINSKTFEYTQVVKQLTIPVFAYSYGADYYDETANITVTVTTPSQYATGYCYVIGGTEHFSANSSFDFNPNTSGDISIYVYAKGGGFDEEKVYYSDSRSASTATLTLLGYPTESTIEVNMDGVIKWGKIAGAAGYIYTLSVVGTDDQNYTVTGVINTNTATLDLSNGIHATNASGETVNLEYSSIRFMTIELQAKGTLTADTNVTSNASVTSEKVTHEWTSALH